MLVKDLRVVGIGNAMVDILIFVEDSFLDEHNITKGVMQLIDLKRASKLYKDNAVIKEISGGSAANTISGLASLNIPTAYIGKVKDDKFGYTFVNDLHNQNIIYRTRFFKESENTQTGRCIVLITKDGERSMNTYLGATEYLKPKDIDKDLIRRSDWLYLEGYRLDGEDSKIAFLTAIETAKQSSTKVSLTLSDPFCISRHFDSFLEIIKDVDLLFCNEVELKMLAKSEDIESALAFCLKEVGMLACTRAEKGAVIATQSKNLFVPTVPIKPVDTTGAGDLFAAGFLYGMISGQDIKTAGVMGNMAASEIISHIGARPEKNLKKLFQENLNLS
jgi:sugar/nucleoside kinase (ribokinase family)